MKKGFLMRKYHIALETIPNFSILKLINHFIFPEKNILCTTDHGYFMKKNYYNRREKMRSKYYAIILSILIMLTMVFTGCDVKMIDNSGLDVSSLSDLGASIGTVWENAQATNIRNSEEGNWDSLAISDPKVIKIGNKYHMWYSGKGADEKWRIGYASSNDGINWTKNSSDYNPIIKVPGFEYEKDGVRVGTVLYDSKYDEYKMWYRGIDKSDSGTSLYLMLAHSKYPDKEWYKYPADSSAPSAPPLYIKKISDYYDDTAKDGLGTISVYIKDSTISDDRLYYMWYTVNYYTESSTSTDYKPILKSCASFDGINFDIPSPFKVFTVDGDFFSEGHYMPSVINDLYDGKPAYKLWFAAHKTQIKDRSFGYAICEESWQVFNPIKEIFKSGEIQADQNGISYPCVIRDGDKYKMWYVGYETTGVTSTYKICYKESYNH